MLKVKMLLAAAIIAAGSAAALAQTGGGAAGGAGGGGGGGGSAGGAGGEPPRASDANPPSAIYRGGSGEIKTHRDDYMAPMASSPSGMYNSAPGPTVRSYRQRRVRAHPYSQ